MHVRQVELKLSSFSMFSFHFITKYGSVIKTNNDYTNHWDTGHSLSIIHMNMNDEGRYFKH